MITGLQCIVPGVHVLRFAREQATRHRDKALSYQDQVDALAKAGVSMEHMSGDPKAGAMNKVKEHMTAADELDFIIQYLKPDETYLLSLHDLQKLGKVTRAW